MRCVVCEGAGTCRACKGSGKSGYFLAHPGPLGKSCPHCNGSGNCPHCDAFGEVEDPVFRPYIYVEAERTRPTSIAMAAISGAPWRFIWIPRRILKRDHEQQRGWVSWCIRRHYRESNGECTLFGSILSYRWKFDPHNTLRFDTGLPDLLYQ
jgi:hypothetical protein